MNNSIKLITLMGMVLVVGVILGFGLMLSEPLLLSIQAIIKQLPELASLSFQTWRIIGYGAVVTVVILAIVGEGETP